MAGERLEQMQRRPGLRERACQCGGVGCGLHGGAGGMRTYRDGLPCGTIFKNRVPTGLWQPGKTTGEELILTRILRLDGLDADNANTLERCIYIHGTNREDQLGTPASHGCIRLGNADMIELFALVAQGDLVDILPATMTRDAG